MADNEEKAQALSAGKTAPLEPVELDAEAAVAAAADTGVMAGGAGDADALDGSPAGAGAAAVGVPAAQADTAPGEPAAAAAADGADAAATAATPSDVAATQVIDLGPEVDLSDPVVAKRIAHGLAPEPTDSKSGDLAGGGLSGLGNDGPSRAFSKERREQKEAEDRLKKERHKKRMRIVRRTLLLIILLVVVALSVALWWLRWGTMDDALAIQGTWRIADTDTTVTITDTKITLTDEVAYDYVIDPEAKTIAYTFGGLTGQGRYRLSLDGNSLAISDGEYDWLSTLLSDIPWTLEAALAELKHNKPISPSLGSGQLLERIGENPAARSTAVPVDVASNVAASGDDAGTGDATGEGAGAAGAGAGAAAEGADEDGQSPTPSEGA